MPLPNSPSPATENTGSEHPSRRATIPGCRIPATSGLATKRSYPRTQNIVVTLLFIGDVIVCSLALAASYFIRFYTPLRHIGPTLKTEPHLDLYLPLIITGTFFLIASYTRLKLYDARLLLRPFRLAEIILRGTTLCFLIFTVISFIFKFEPSISRFFTAIAYITTLVAMIAWRYGFHQWLLQSRWRERISQRLVFIGWSKDAARLTRAIATDRGHAFQTCGMVLDGEVPSTASAHIEPLGRTDQLDALIKQHLIDTAVLVDLNMPREKVLELAVVCQRNYVDLKIIPSFFQTFVSGLQMQTIAGVPILGVESLPLSNPLNRLLKRVLDIVGALVGLIGSIPVMLVLAALIKRESPGPVIYRQIRSGRDGRPFTIYKLRSMRIDAEAASGARWAVEADPRRLKIGAFMREWNLDELPQFWNVLKGDMSLVGPRPERPELIAQFDTQIQNYHLRHEVRPGLTGWAQVHGLRGNTSLEERIRYDLFYIENWSLVMEFQIMGLTFLRRQNAY